MSEHIQVISYALCVHCHVKETFLSFPNLSTKLKVPFVMPETWSCQLKSEYVSLSSGLLQYWEWIHCRCKRTNRSIVRCNQNEQCLLSTNRRKFLKERYVGIHYILPILPISWYTSAKLILPLWAQYVCKNNDVECCMVLICFVFTL